MSSAESRKLAYTVAEAAKQLSISRAQIYRLIDLKELDSVQIGRSRRITHRQLEAFIESLEARSRIAALPEHRRICRDGRNSQGLSHG